MKIAKLRRLMLEAFGVNVSVENTGQAVLVTTTRDGVERRAMGPTKATALLAAIGWYGGRRHTHTAFGLDGEEMDEPILCERRNCDEVAP